MIEVIQGDITIQEVDAIVNAANNMLLGGGGVDGAIHRAAGQKLLDECRTLNGCNTGNAKITKGYNLPSKYVIHAVGPIWRGGNNKEDELLASCYKKCLEIALDYQIKTIAFPNISTGVYGFPKNRAVKIALDEVSNFLIANKDIEKVVFVCFDNENYELYKKVLNL